MGNMQIVSIKYHYQQLSLIDSNIKFSLKLSYQVIQHSSQNILTFLIFFPLISCVIDFFLLSPFLFPRFH